MVKMVIAYVNQDGTLSDEAAYYGNRTMLDSIKKVADTDGITAYVLPLSPIYPENKTRNELTEILQNVLQEGLDSLHKKVLKNS